MESDISGLLDLPELKIHKLSGGAESLRYPDDSFCVTRSLADLATTPVNPSS